MSALAGTQAAGRPGASRVLTYAVLALFVIFFLLPPFVMLTTSFKSLDEIRLGNMMALPSAPTIEPWLKAWGAACIGLTCIGIKGFFLNSLLMVVPAVAISTALGAINGYVLTKWTFPGHRVVFGLMLFACFIPFQSVLIPAARVLGILGLANSIPGLVIVPSSRPGRTRSW